MEKTIVVRAKDTKQVAEDWGGLTWYASRELGNCEEMTLGRCVLRPGKSNPKHSHPNCAEVLVVLKGRIRHTTEGGEVELGEGDCVSIKPGFAHQAVNIGDADAELFIAFSSADREVVGE